jgi:hypothetical protein
MSKNIKTEIKQMANGDTTVKSVTNEETGETREAILHQSHGRPKSRREFLASGLIGTTGYLVMPTLLSVFAKPMQAFAAAQCEGTAIAGAASLPAFVGVNLAGGYAFQGGAVIGLGLDRKPIANYDIVGMGTGNGFFSNNTQSSTMFSNSVRVPGDGTVTTTAGKAGLLMSGIKSRVSATTLAKTAMIQVMVTSNDDNSDNLASPLGMVTSAGLSGDLLGILGTQNTATGIGQKPALAISPPPVFVPKSFADITAALKPANSLTQRLSLAQYTKVLDLIKTLSGEQARALASTGASATTLSDLVQCATDKNLQLAAGADPTTAVDPGLNAQVATVWGLAPATKTSANYKSAAIAFNAINGHAMAGMIELGGYDYHGAGRASQNASDLRAGQMIGNILETAAILGRKVVIHVTSDGAVSANSGGAFGSDYNNDAGQHGGTFALFFDPAGAPLLKNDAFGYQIGALNNGQGNVGGVVSSAAKGAASIFANWAQFAGKPEMISSILKTTFSATDLNEVVRIA